MSGGSPEQALLSAACSQVGNMFDLPTGTACGMTDSKMLDYQAGAERAYTLNCAATSGANIVYESAGMYASLLGTCPESLLLDNDTLGAVMRITRGIEVNAKTLSLDDIKDVVFGNKGHYLGSSRTLEVMQTEYLYPELGDRLSPDDWNDAQRPDPVRLAIQKTRDLLNNDFPDHISDEIDRQIRERFPIHLSREAIGRTP